MHTYAEVWWTLNWATGQVNSVDEERLLLVKFKPKNGVLELQPKGSGETPYSRHSDGKAVLISIIILASEAMFHLGVPTTRVHRLLQPKE